MKKSMGRLLGSLFLAMVMGLEASGQDMADVLVQVYDPNLDPVSDLGVTLDGAQSFVTDASGVAFVSVPQGALPPEHIEIADPKLEAESWNYSKGTLEIIVRKKSYRKLKITIVDPFNTALPGIDVHVSPIGLTLTSDANGYIFPVVSHSIDLNDPDLIVVDGYRVAHKDLSEAGGVIRIEEIKPLVETAASEDTVSGPASSAAPAVAVVTSARKTEDNVFPRDELGLQDLDSVNSLTILYTLMKRMNYDQLDSSSRMLLDDKFNELVYQHGNSSTSQKPTLGVISDSTVVNEDIMLIIEKVQNERKMLIQFREQFADVTDQIRLKLRDGGKSLDASEREQLIQLVVDLKEMLRNNEELFYKNNAFYNEQVEALQQQLAKIYELEDQLFIIEEMSRKFKEQLMIASLIIVGTAPFILLLIYLVRTLRTQKNELTKTKAEIEHINLNLEDMVAEKTASLELTHSELDTFLYRSSHNLKRPLTSIRGLANIARITLDSEGIGLFEKVELTTRDMENMLDKLAMMNHINQPSDFGEINLTQTVERIMEGFSNIIKSNHIELHVSIDPEIWFKSYQGVIDILLKNLLENACFFSQFSQEDASKIYIEAYAAENGRLGLRIRDNGCGIEDAVLDKIWDMFFVGNELSKGNGLGLFITKKAVDALRGAIQVNTEARKYCEFDISIPALELSIETSKEEQTLTART